MIHAFLSSAFLGCRARPNVGTFAAYVCGDRDIRLPRTSNRIGFDMALVAILCPVCVHVGFARAEPLPRVLTCSRCHHKQNFSRPTPRQRSTDGNRYATDGLMPYGSRQPGRPTLHVDLGAPTLTRPGAARSDGAQITRNSFAWVQMEHRHRASIHRERTPRRYTRDLSRVLGLRECQEFG